MMQKKKMLLMIGLIIGGWAMQHPRFEGNGGDQPPDEPPDNRDASKALRALIDTTGAPSADNAREGP